MMKLTLRRVVTSEPIRIEDEIYFEDDSPPMVQYKINEKVSSSFSPETLDGSIHPITTSQVTIIFPLIEKLCREIFDSESDKD